MWPLNKPPSSTDRHRRFYRLIHPHLPNLYRAAYRLTANQADAEDLLQEALLKAFIHMDSLREETNPSGWAYTIMKNIFLNQAPGKARAPSPMDTLEIQNRLPSPDPVPGDDVDSALSQGLTDALMAMPEEMRVILVAREVEGLSYQQIAELMSLSLGTVKSRINRARERLRSIYIGERENS